MQHQLDWSSYATAGQGDAYAGIPASGGDFARAVAVCINDRQCQRQPEIDLEGLTLARYETGAPALNPSLEATPC